MATCAVQDDIIVGAQDKRKYQVMTLDNGLRCLLISDPATDKAATAMNVHAGFFCDPEELPGVAHFCEHMVFLGTEKYPEEDEYITFLNKHNGQHNAFTGAEDTNYFFEISTSGLQGALDRFSQFFISPLFTQTATEREMKAIDSENNKNLQSDAWRLEQLQMSTASKNHPYHKFGTGNLETLNKSNVRDALMAYHSKYYSANLMTLAILGKEDLTTLGKWVQEYFSAVPNKNAEAPKFNGVPFEPEHLQKQFKVVPVKDLRRVTLTWALPPQKDNYTSKPSHYLAHLVGHEGPGSLLSLLKNKGWGLELMAGEFRGCDDFTIWSIVIDLTPEGLEHTDDVISTCFQYIKLVREQGIQKWISEELQKTSKMNFDYQDKQGAMGFVSKKAGHLYEYPAKQVLSGPSVVDAFDEELLKQTISHLTPEKMRVVLISKDFDGVTDSVSPWYSAKYCVEDIPQSKIQAWAAVELNSGLVLPEPNPFVPDDLTVKKAPEETTIPKMVRNSEISRLWHLQDSTFLLPKAVASFSITTPLTYLTPANVVMAKMFTKLLADSLNEFAYAADMGGLQYNVIPSIEGLQMIINGYNCKQSVLLKKVFEKMVSLDVVENRFVDIKEKVYRGLLNFRKDQPYSHAIYNTSMCIEVPRWNNEEYIECCSNITIDKLKAFIPELLSNLFIESLMEGNITEKEALDTMDIIESILKPKKLYNRIPEQRIVQFAQGKDYIYRVKGTDPDNENSAIENIYILGVHTIRDSAIRDLFCQIIQPACYNELRTVQQLGYIVHSGPRSDNGVDSLRIIVQSATKSPDHLDKAAETFFESVKLLLEELTDEQFDNYKQATIALKLQKDKNLGERASRHWAQIVSPRTYCFDKAEQQAEVLKGLTKDDIIDFYNKYIAPKSETRRKLSCQIWGKLCDIETAEDSKDTVVISNFRTFKHKMPLYERVSSFYPGL